MVRAIKLQVSGSGSYYNPSQGVFTSVRGSEETMLTKRDEIRSTAAVRPMVSPAGRGISRASLAPLSRAGEPSALFAIMSMADAGATPATTNVWLDDALPTGANPGVNGGDSWTWINANPAPYSGALAHQSAIAAGLHQQYFDWASATLGVNTGEVLFTYIYLDPANLPSEVLLEWNSGTWEHRAYWGANKIAYGTDGTVSRHYMGPLPAAGQWVRLEVPASVVGLENSSLRGMTFTLYDGRATWDYTGKTLPGISSTNPPDSGGGTVTNIPPVIVTNPPVVITNPPPTTNTYTPPAVLNFTNAFSGATNLAWRYRYRLSRVAAPETVDQRPAYSVADHTRTNAHQHQSSRPCASGAVEFCE